MSLLSLKIPTAVLVISLMSACASDYGPKQTVGGVVGGAGGAVAGAQFGKGRGQIAATALGTLLGAYLGSEVGKSLDSADREAAYRAEQRAYTSPMGQTITWNNPQSGNSGSYTPVRDGNDQSGNYCREYQSKVTVQGKTQNAYGTACRQPDGDWKIVN